MQITERIEAQRAAAGLSETQLATLSGIPRMTLKRKMANPADFTISQLARIADALNVTVGFLIGYEDAA